MNYKDVHMYKLFSLILWQIECKVVQNLSASFSRGSLVCRAVFPPLEMKPDWWPGDIPWQNVRSDMRTPEKKKEVPWTEGLRRIVISCYLHHGRLDLLPEFSIEHLPQISAEAAQQIQLQLERLQQQGGVMGRSVRGVEGEGGAEGMVEHAASGTQLTEAGGGEVFTVDTGIGNCDNSGMPTLADATLAEAAAKLQQVCVCACLRVCVHVCVFIRWGGYTH